MIRTDLFSLLANIIGFGVLVGRRGQPGADLRERNSLTGAGAAGLRSVVESVPASTALFGAWFIVCV
jgi:hypothetical protein